MKPFHLREDAHEGGVYSPYKPIAGKVKYL